MTQNMPGPDIEPNRTNGAAPGGTPPSASQATDREAEGVWATSSRPYFGPNPLTTAALPAPEREMHPEARSEEHRIISRPTQTWGYRWLGVGVALGSAAALGTATGVTLIAGTYLAYAASPVVTAVTALLVASSWKGTHLRFMGNSQSVSRGASKTHLRLTEIARGLVSQLGLEMPVFVEGSETMGVNPFSRPTTQISYNHGLLEQLSDDQCESFLAHELCHCKQAFPMIWFEMRCANSAAVLSATMACSVYFLNTGSSLAYSSLLGAGCYLISGIALNLLCLFPERANEIRTDIQAVELTQNLESSVAALQFAYDFLYKQRSEGWRPFIAALQPIASHPSLAMRVRWLRYVCERS